MGGMMGGMGGGATAKSRPARVRIVNGRVVLSASNTELRFVGTQPTGELYEAGFGELSGVIRVNGSTVTEISLTVPADSLWSEDEELLARLQGGEFLAVKEHSTIVFRSTEVVRDEDGFTITGDLTLRGVTQTIRFPASIDVANRGLSLKTRFTVDRTKFGMDFPVDQLNKEVSVDVQIAQRRGRRRSSANRNSSRSRAKKKASSQPKLSDADQLAQHAANWLKKFDSNEDGVLAKEEWSQDGFVYNAADANDDGNVTLAELRDAMGKK